MISIESIAKEQMIKDAVRNFPDECCGFFYGTEDETGNRMISEVLIVDNAKEGDKRKRFEVSPKDYLKAEQFAEESGLDLLGVYHSHPDHPAIPSEHDRKSAQPYFSYIIISVYGKEIKDIRSWRLNNEFQFEEEEINQTKEEINN
ncbi:MAG TPA: M67 family metallopeptidase [Chitinophagaceae bacterium]